MNKRKKLIKTLECLLVKEFRAYQDLHNLTRDVRLALSTGDAHRLFSLTERKDTLLDNLNRLEEAKYEILQNLGLEMQIMSTRGKLPSLAEVLGFLDKEDASRLVRLQEGILLLMEQTYEMTHGNHALASSELERASAYTFRWKEALTHVSDHSYSTGEKSARIFQPGSESPWSKAKNMNDQACITALLAAIIAARNALDLNDQTGIPTAISELQNALKYINAILMRNGTYQKQMRILSNQGRDAQHTYPDPLHQDADENLVQVIANLYHQETAYHAVLKVSDRMLSSG